jgi:hypothetical protein
MGHWEKYVERVKEYGPAMLLPDGLKWAETSLGECGHADIAETNWGDWDILWHFGEDDYQGSAGFLGRKGDRFVFYEWSWGS